jgi:hypothetical protein
MQLEIKAAHLSDNQAARIAHHTIWLRTHAAITGAWTGAA